MDKIDRKILSLLQENARYPLKYLAQKVFLSSPAVSTRIERMEKAGIITGYHATIDPVALGYHITAFINLTLDPKQKNEFYPYVTDCPNVLECNCVTGTYSYYAEGCFSQHNGVRYLYRASSAVWEHTNTDCVFDGGSSKRGGD